MFTLGEIIDLAIRIEKNGENTYRKAREEVSNPSLASMLQWLAEDEVEHEKWFARLKEEIETTEEDLKLEEMGKAILQGVLGDQAFSIKDADFSRIEDINSLLELSVEFEKDTILFYEMLSSFIDDEETLRQLDKIIKEEICHVQVLEEFLEKKKVLPASKA
ncbi:MAG: ferritin family protein [Desulfobacteraceae bacterium]|nr:MAG: ferritin family protein [Desulfobacteraceae bacterium]